MRFGKDVPAYVVKIRQARKLLDHEAQENVASSVVLMLLTNRRNRFFVHEKGKIILIPSEQIDRLLAAQSRPIGFPVACFIKPIGDSRRHSQHVIDRGLPRNPRLAQAEKFGHTGIQAKFPCIYQLQDGDSGKHLGNGSDAKTGVQLVLDFPRSVRVPIGRFIQATFITLDQDNAREPPVIALIG